MKYNLIILIIFFICVFAVSKVNASVNNLDLLGKVIYIDAGHERLGINQI